MVVVWRVLAGLYSAQAPTHQRAAGRSEYLTALIPFNNILTLYVGQGENIWKLQERYWNSLVWNKSLLFLRL